MLTNGLGLVGGEKTRSYELMACDRVGVGLPGARRLAAPSLLGASDLYTSRLAMLLYLPRDVELS